MKELETPPSEPVRWEVRQCDPHGVPFGATAIVKSQTWFLAREEGAKVLGVDRYQVNVKRAAP
jgi:hypothetical protein